MKPGIIRIGEWTIDLDLDLLSNGKKVIGLTKFKEDMVEKYPDLVEKYRLSSKLIRMRIVKMVAWDSVVNEAIKLNILK